MSSNNSTAASSAAFNLLTFTAGAVVATVSILVFEKFASKKKHNTNKKKDFRIVSLCPSTTLTLYDLGLGKYVVGRTKYCQDLETRQIPAYGGTKNPNWEKIRDQAKPTHILFNMEENDHTHLPIAQKIGPTITETPVTVQGSRHMVQLLGLVFGVEDRAQEICRQMDAALEKLQTQQLARKKQFTYLYFIWHTPAQRVVGQGTYIHALLEAAGGINLAVETISHTERYPLLPENYTGKADFCLLATEPFHFQEKHLAGYEPFGTCVEIINGEMLSWSGSSTVEGLRYLAEYFREEDDYHYNIELHGNTIVPMS